MILAQSPLEGAPLELHSQHDAVCHVLAGRRVRLGDRIEILLADGQWLAGIYEWSGHSTRWPGLRIALGGVAPSPDLRPPSGVVAIPPDARLRWPEAMSRSQASGGSR